MTQTTPALSENCWLHLFYTAVSLLKIFFQSLKFNYFVTPHGAGRVS